LLGSRDLFVGFAAPFLAMGVFGALSNFRVTAR
jgi:hypothetical protein